MTTLPEWRRTAPPGISLKEAMPRTPIVSATPARYVGAAAPITSTLEEFVRPEARPHWRGARVSTYTPQYVEWMLSNGAMGDLQAQWEMFDLMEGTWPRLAKNLSEVKRAVTGMKWSVVPWAEDNKPPTDEAKRRADLVSHIVWNMRPQADEEEVGFTGLLTDLMDAWGKGCSLSELVWEERSSPSHGNILALRAAQWVSIENYGIMDSGGIGLRQKRDTDLTTLPPYKFLVATARAKSSHWMGSALLRPLAWWWAAANFGATWLLNYAQIFGVPLRWATFPTGATEDHITKLNDALRNMGSRAWGSFPEGTSLDIKEGNKTAGESPQDGVLDRAEKQCDLLVLGQTLTSDPGDKGTQALGTVHERVKSDVVEAASNWLADILTQQLSRMICELNYGDADFLPEFRPSPIKSKDYKGMADRDAVLLGSGIPLPKLWLYDRHDIPVPRPDEEVIEKIEPTFPGLGGADNAPRPNRTPDTDTDRADQRAQAADAKRPDAIAEAKANILAAAYRGALAPFRQAILDSTSPDDAIARVRALYADWSPAKVARLVEEALQLAAAAGLTEVKKP